MTSIPAASSAGKTISILTRCPPSAPARMRGGRSRSSLRELPVQDEMLLRAALDGEPLHDDTPSLARRRIRPERERLPDRVGERLWCARNYEDPHQRGVDHLGYRSDACGCDR